MVWHRRAIPRKEGKYHLLIRLCISFLCDATCRFTIIPLRAMQLWVTGPKLSKLQPEACSLIAHLCFLMERLLMIGSLPAIMRFATPRGTFTGQRLSKTLPLLHFIFAIFSEYVCRTLRILASNPLAIRVICTCPTTRAISRRRFGSKGITS
jgi:hypothetical protein